MPHIDHEDEAPRHGWFRSFGWLLMLVLAVAIGGPAGRAIVLVYGKHKARVGDGINAATYGFDLSNLRVSRDLLVGGGMPRDYLPVLNDPAAIAPKDIAALNEGQRRIHKGAFLVDSDLVVGVAIGGEARAYPINVLNWHEIVNDTLGGVPIAITYSGLCDSVAVFDRRVGGETLRFGHSGLVFNSNLVIYDVRADGSKPSLWSQLQARAIAGPAAASGARLKVLPVALTSYQRWLADHPDTTVLRGDADYGLERYGTSPFEPYYVSGGLKYPVRPLAPPTDAAGQGWGTMSPVVAIQTATAWKVLQLKDVEEHAGPGGVWRTELDGVPVQVEYDRRSHTATVEGLDGQHPVPVVYARWFAWNAMYSESGSLR
jgi:hypothetical protein